MTLAVRFMGDLGHSSFEVFRCFISFLLTLQLLLRGSVVLHTNHTRSQTLEHENGKELQQVPSDQAQMNQGQILRF